MKIAISVWYKSRFTTRDYNKFIEKGIEYAEFSLDYPWPYWEPDNFKKEISKVKDNGLKIGSHLPWRDIQLASPYPELRKGAVKYLISLGETLSASEVEYGVLHVSTREAIKEKHKNNIMNGVLEDLMELTDYYKSLGINIAIENLPMGPSSTRDFLVPLIKKSGSTACFDIAHLITKILLNNKDTTRKTVEDKVNEWAKTLEQFITLVHIHGVVKVNSSIMEHYLLDDYYNLYIPVLQYFNTKKEHMITTLEIFYRDADKNPATPTILAKSAEILLKRFYSQ